MDYIKKHNFIKRIKERFFLRFHMSLILVSTAFSGLLATKVLLLLNVKEMLIRYPLAVVLSYLVFFVLIKIWLWYVSSSTNSRENSTVGDVLDVVGNSIDLPIDLPIGFPSGGGGSLGFGGGSSGGGGASASFDIGDTSSEMVSSASEGVGSAAGDVASGIFEEGGIVLIVFGLLLVAISGAGIYLVYEAPMILAEAAFEALLATSLIRTTKRIDEPDWMGSVFRSTIGPFLIVLVLVLLLAGAIESYWPNAAKLSDVWN